MNERDPYEGLGTPVDPYEGIGSPASNPLTNAATTAAESAVRGTGQAVGGTWKLADILGGEMPQRATIEIAKRLGLIDDHQATLAHKLTDLGMRFTPDAMALHSGAENAAESGKAIESLADYYHPDPARQKEFWQQVAGAAGGLAPAMVSPATGLPVLAGQFGQAERDAAKQQGDSDELADAKFKLGATGGAAMGLVPEVKLAKPLLAAAAKPLAGAGLNTLQDLLMQKAIDPDKPLDRARLKFNALFGGLFGAFHALPDAQRALVESKLKALPKDATAQDVAAAVKEVVPAADDTGANLPERPADLEAQQQQLVRGDRMAQMFPKGTKELPLPEGFDRVETPRGVFHFDPNQVTSAEVQDLSRQGKENMLLGLGPYNKAEIQRRAATGEPVATVVERGPNGEELRAAAATSSTAKETADYIKSVASPDSTVNLEQMADTLRRRGGLDDMLAEADQQRQQRDAAQAKETAERTARQQAVQGKRGQFEFHLGNASAIADRLGVGGASESSPSVAEVSGSANVLRDYLSDNSLGLTLDQKQRAQALLAKLEPAEARLKGEAEQATQARLDEEKRQREAAEAEQKQRIDEERRQLAAQKDIDPMTGKKRLDMMTEDELTAEAQRGNKDALRLLEQQSAGKSTDDDDDLLTVLKKVKLPSEDATMGSELTDLSKEWTNFGQRQQLFTGKPGSLDQTAEVLRGHGFTDIQTPADVIEFTKRALRGEKILPSLLGGQEQVDFARQKDESAGDDSAATSDPFTGVPTYIRGRRVTAAQALRIAERNRAAQVHPAEADAGTAGRVAGQKLGELPVIRDGDELVNQTTGQRLPLLGRGVEAEAYVDRAKGTVYKVFVPGEQGSLTQRLTIDRDGMAIQDTGGMRDVAEKVRVLNALGGTPTELLGYTADGELLVKQPLGDTGTWREPEGAARKARLVEVPEEVLPRPKNASKIYLSRIDDKPVLVADLHQNNFIGDTLGRDRVNDLITRTIMPEDLQHAPKLREWITAQGFRADAPGPAEFARLEESPEPKLADIEAKMTRGGVDRDVAARAVNRYIDVIEGKGKWPNRMETVKQGRKVETNLVDKSITDHQARALHAAVKEYDAGGKFNWPDEGLREMVMANFAKADAPRSTGGENESNLAAADFEARLKRIAPGLMLQYRVLVGDPTMLHSMGVRPEQLTGRETAAHFAKRRALWFLADRVRADKDGLMDDRLRRDVLHETGHAWIDSLDRDQQHELVDRWLADKADPKGWLAVMRREGVKLRAGVDSDWKEYWAERLADENTRWAAGRERGLVGDRSFVSQMAYDFRQWLREAFGYLQQAFTRTKRYNVDFREFLDDRRFSRPEPAAAVPAPLAAARATGIDFAREPAPEERKAALLRELNDINREMAAMEGKDGPRIRATQRTLLGQRSELRSQLDSEFKGWREEQPKLANGEAVTLPDRKTELINRLKEAESNARRDVVGADSWAKKYRELLDKEFPGWEKKPAEAGPAAEDTEPVPPPDMDFAERPGIYSEVEGHTHVRQPWAERTWESMKRFFAGFRGHIPELPMFADDKAQQFQRLRQFDKLIKRGTPRVWKESADQVGEIVKPLLDAGKLDPNSYDRLAKLQARVRQLREQNREVPADIKQEIGALNREVEREPYGLFQKIALYLDLKWRVENLKDDQGNAITQPGGINVKEINTRLAELKQKLDTNPHRDLVLDALREHQALVKSIAEDLRARDLRVPEDLQNPFYFPHVVLDRVGDAVAKVKMDTAEDFRGYLMKPVGSLKPIETDYAKAMYYHLVAVGSHNLRSDLVRDYVKPYDIMPQVKDRAKELAKQYGRPVSWREAFATEHAKDGFTAFYPDDKLPMQPEMTINRDTLARRLGVALTDEPLQAQLETLGLRGIKLLPEDIHEALAAGEREVWIMPEKVTEALNGMLRRAERRAPEGLEGAVGATTHGFTQAWKWLQLFAPWNNVRYQFNNTVSDMEKLFSADPEVFRRLPEAARDVRQFIEEGKGSRDVHEAFKQGVLDSVTAAEMNDLTALKQFEALKTHRDNLRDLAKRATTLFLAGNRGSVEVSRLREAAFRFAKFKADLDRLRNGARPVYAGAYWRDIDAIKDSRPGANDANYLKAAEISLATFVDHHSISIAGGYIRKHMIPFYTWVEGNFRYHANLFRNLYDMTAAGDMAAADAAKAGTRALAVGAATFTRKAAAGLLLRLALPYAAVALWNNSQERRQLEDGLSAEDKRRFHIILGKDENGKTMVVYGNTALADVIKWFGGMDFMRLTTDYFAGRTDFKTAFSQWVQQFPRDFANNLFQVGPIPRMIYTKLAGKNVFPDVTNQRTIPANEMKWVILSQATDQTAADLIRRATDKDYLAPKDLKDWAQQAILQVRKRDPQQWAFYEVKDKAAAFLEAQTGQTRSNDYNAPDQQVLRNFRRAIYRGDVENAMRFYDRLLEFGYTAERFKASIRAQDPLSDLPKKLRQPFLDSLSPFERSQVQRAYEFYTRMAVNEHKEFTLFPSEKVPEPRRLQYQPHYDRLQQQIQTVDQMSDEETTRRADRELRESLRPAARR